MNEIDAVADRLEAAGNIPIVKVTSIAAMMEVGMDSVKGAAPSRMQ